ncbi:MAG: GTP-binding protein, partial [Promethearchaeota archaeon]
KNLLKKDYSFKIVVIGEPGVGKTSLVKRFVSGFFSKEYKASIGTNMYIKRLNLGNLEVLLSLWDIAGQEQWASMRHKYYKGSQGAFIVGDVSREITFKKIKSFWNKDLREYCPEIPVILIANKDDLQKEIKKQEIKKIGDEIHSTQIIFTSAKSGDNVNNAFHHISELIVKKSKN